MSKPTTQHRPATKPAKNPKVLMPLKELSETARKQLNLPKCAPRERQKGEALPRTLAISTAVYRAGDGDSHHTQRPGAGDAYRLPSRGLRA